MARVNAARLTRQEQTDLRNELVRSVRVLRKNDVGRFLSDLLTPSEVLMLGRRIRIAKALLAGDRYEEIAYKHKVSFSTIQLVDRAIQRGLEGYRRTLRRVSQKKRGVKISNETIETLRHLPGAGYFRFWYDLLDSGEEK
ncbi:MAG: hypothetical protein G01um1014106_363 [Parcubacteria group bacterium Gr01-1014_106]|nr:MAG: hypothetical protein G01um1014106_363 [Parcubacteria group bacterium Gr01-1014_106]